MPRTLFYQLKPEKQERILAAALAEFVRYKDCYAKASVNRIAENAGIAVGSLYKYFEDKNDLFYAVYGKYAKALQTRPDTSSLKSYFEGRIRLVDGTEDFTAEQEALLDILRDKNDDLVSSLVFKEIMHSEVFCQEVEALENDRRNGILRDGADTEIAAFLYHSLDLLALRYIHSTDRPREDLPDVLNRMMDILLHGI